MLKLKSVANCNNEDIEFDDYIPFTVDFFNIKDSAITPLYWRCNYKKKSLLEVGINKESGVISSITLTTIDKKNIYLKESLDLLYNDITHEDGIPIFDINIWKNSKNEGDFFESFLEVEEELFLNIYDMTLELCIGSKAVIRRIIRNNRFSFCYDDFNQLKKIIIDDVSIEEKDRFFEATDFLQK